MKLFNSHLSTQDLADVIDGRLAANETFNSHLADCAHCNQEFSALETAVGLMRRDDSADAPQEAYQFARNLFRTRKGFVPQSETLTQKILANLKLDLSALAPAFSERSGAVSDERQMLFEAGEFDIDLRVRKAAEGFAVNGQVLGDVPASSRVRLQNEQSAFEVAVGETGEFSFDHVPAGVFSLHLLLGEIEVVSELVLQ